MPSKNWSQAIAAILAIAHAAKSGFLDEATAKTTINAILRNYGKHISSKRLRNLISVRAGQDKMDKEKILEHAVPLDVIVKKIILLPLKSVVLTQENITNLAIELQDYLMEVVVLKEEDQLLESHKLSKEMPARWKWGDSAIARYSEVGIEILKN